MTSSLKENPRLRAAAEEMKKQGVKIGDAVSEAMKAMDESDFMRIEYFHHTTWILLNPFIFLAFQLITFHLVEADHAWLEKFVRHRGGGLYAISLPSQYIRRFFY